MLAGEGRLSEPATLDAQVMRMLADAMRRETELLFDHLVRDDGSVVELLTADYTFVNERDHRAYNLVHHAASRGDFEMILYLVLKGADVLAVSRKGQTTADMANGPLQRIQPFPRAVWLLERLGAKNNDNCVSY